MAILPDLWLMVAQAIPFAITLIVLQKVIFGPMLAYLADRDTAIVGSREDALRLQAKAESRIADYEAQGADARATISEERNTARGQALTEREAAIAAARAEAEQKISEAVQVIEGEQALAAEELERLSRVLAGDISTRILGTEVAAT